MSSLSWCCPNEEERVRLDSSGGAEGEPTAPDSASLFVRFLLFQVQDDLIVCSARMRKEEILLGSGEILKSAGINCGVWE
jgi:hypothetical protein